MKLTKKLLNEMIKEELEAVMAERQRVYDYKIGVPGFKRSELSPDYEALVKKVEALNFDELEKEYPGISKLKRRIYTEEPGVLMYIDKYLDSKQYEKIMPMIKAEDDKAAYFRGGRSGGRSRSA
jgi:23S rRNA A2030 N6-methylase RlmJ